MLRAYAMSSDGPVPTVRKLQSEQSLRAMSSPPRHEGEDDREVVSDPAHTTEVDEQ